ncbi:MAG: GrpB family protein [Candidatus Pristimantibacillus sp.]
MEIVYFNEQSNFHVKAERLFLTHKQRIEELIPGADVQHVGSTAIPDSLTKGDLDIQVRVPADQFKQAIQALSSCYERNDGSDETDCFRAYKDDATDPPLGVQLTIIHSEMDFFWKFRDVLNGNKSYRDQYDKLKQQYNGADMEDGSVKKFV